MIYLVAPERRKWFLVKTTLFESDPIPDEDWDKEPHEELEKDPLVKALLDEGTGFVAVPVMNTGGNNLPDVYCGDATNEEKDHLFGVLQSGEFYGKVLTSAEAVALMNYLSGREDEEE